MDKFIHAPKFQAHLDYQPFRKQKEEVNMEG